ncbi:BspA family leucine-rich repeat surface protein [Flavobacterium zepuense]|uniref:BspA family leucine-rich repeat surface protein n=1 Tax=Flavobacterium zepuense TaxID=2593302 RepID=A0A552V0B9_9FLAO|nr:BspA family leucine-rich repeat surface protein [Flavobacterium zepuense]TRW23923.1 BspA family leucine-rich repeat surface protein [Flavobacterium zepuense]
MSHTYTTVGTFTVSMSGIFGRLDATLLDIEQDAPQLISVDQWGTNQWTSMENAFANCANLEINATDAPNLSQATSLKRMFYDINDINTSLNNWDVSTITDMSSMFYFTSYSQSLGNWDVSNVTDMSNMFSSCGFGGAVLDLNNWDVSNVTNMYHMFSQVSIIEPLNNWDVSNVTDMSYMFYQATTFDQPLNNWDVSNVTNMAYMFCQTNYNQPLNDWDVSNVTDMSNMFFNVFSFNQPLDNWDVSNVTNMRSMFYNANAFNQPLDSWDVSNVTNMTMMFFQADSFNQPLNNWNVSALTEMTMMFRNADLFNQPLNNWDVSNVTQMGSFVEYATSFNQDLSDWNFNPDVDYFNMGYTALDTQNYDALLLRFAQLGLQNKSMGAYGISYCDSGVREYLINELEWNIADDTLGEECGGNTITGNVLFDSDANGCDSADITANNFLVTANNGEFTYSTITSNGEYDLHIMEDTYNVGLLNVPSYYAVTPPSSEVSFTGFGNEQELNFCLTANQSVNDLNITLLPLNEARPGFESNYRLIVQNIGTLPTNGTIAGLSYNETIQTFVTSSQAPSTATTNGLNFDLGTLQPFESQIIDITMQTFTPPTVNGGEIINFVAAVTPNTADLTPDDNTFIYDQDVVNSYDPNDKTVLQGSDIYMEQTGGYLDYIIRFQNTGSASAITVRIEDLLHENLDWATFQPITASHAYTVEVTDGNKVKFIFNNINLPHEAANEPASHGFIAYKIKPVGNIQVGDMITGQAGIFFDYNLPIITNSADTQVVETLGINKRNLQTIALYPNPAHLKVNLDMPDGIQAEGIKIFNLQGVEILSQGLVQNAIDVSNLSSGIYIVKIQTNKGFFTNRLIKK